ncbi:hypothetical protein [Vibrio sp. 10N]|uniref:hypothetical protein n=1 Tax=Vibrio sp. 10N TaxID=3058938 RepID=UPI002812FD95|nr:hypothetical protein VB10N_14470 [Vibrio sp. 10N]
MINLIRLVIVANVVAALIIFGLGLFVPFFKVTNLMDGAFFNAASIWFVTALIWDGGKISRNYDADIPAHSVKSMVTEHDLQGEKHQHYRQNYSFGLSLFIAGAIPMLTAILLSLIW